MLKIIPIRCYFEAGDAHVIISFLDELKEALWTGYGDDIIKMHQENVTLQDDAYCDEMELDFDLGDDIPFQQNVVLK